MEIKTEYKKVLFNTQELDADEYKISIDEQQANIQMEIKRLKSELQESDYKITKIAEAMSIGAELPYDAQELHKERQALRDKINQLEMEVQSVEDEQ